MNLHDEIRRLQKAVIKIRFDSDRPLISPEAIRAIQRQAQLGQAVHKSHAEHMQRVCSGYNVRMN